MTIRDTRFENRQLTSLGIELMNLSDLRAKIPVELLAQPERVDFYMMMLVTSGEGIHTVDFKEWPLSVGAMLFVRPSQVQQWQTKDEYSAQVVLIAPSALPNREIFSSTREGELLSLFEWQTYTQLPKTLAEDISDITERMHRDLAGFDGSDVEIFLIRHQLLALLFRLARWQHSLAPATHRTQRSFLTYRLFVRELEESFHHHHSLKYYAHRLGYAESTISRACLAAEGRSAKLVIDRRIALEGQRLLAHGVSSVAQISYDLGFSEPTNFVKFFKRITNETPYKFRKERTVH